MGADLYRQGHEAIYARHKPAWDAALARRNAVIEAWEQTHPVEAVTVRTATCDISERPYPEHVRDYIRAEEDAFDAMRPPTHYFRDSYNLFERMRYRRAAGAGGGGMKRIRDSSLLSRLDLSWWADVTPLCDADQRDNLGAVWSEEHGDYLLPDGNVWDGYQTPWVARQFLARFATPANLARLKAIPDADDRAYFLEKYDRLCHFLQASIDAGDGISYSL